jgi:hypothetical protein
MVRGYGRAILAILALVTIALVPAARTDAADNAPSPHGRSGAAAVALSGEVTFLNFHSGKCLGVANGNVSDGGKVVQYPCDGTANQRWTVRSVPEQGFPFYELRNGADITKCLGVPGGSSDMGAQLVVWTCNGHLDQRWISYPVYFQDIFLGYTVVNRNSGQNMGVAGSSTDVAAVVQWWGDGSNNQIWQVR